MPAYVLDTNGVRDIAPDVLDGNGRLKVMPAIYYAHTTLQERALLCLNHGFYCLPTDELVLFLNELILEYGSCVEIGSGNGVLAEALGIRATDNYMQERPDIRETYERAGQKVVQYGPNVENIEAIAAIKKYQPRLVLGSWVTHRWRPDAHARGGNMYAPNEFEILRSCAAYVLIGNTTTHAQHPLLETRARRYLEPDWLYSRAMRPKNFIGVWTRHEAAK